MKFVRVLRQVNTRRLMDWCR